MCSKNRDSIGNVTDPERFEQREQLDVLIIDEVHVEEASVSSEAVGGSGDSEVEEGEGEGEGARESGEGSSERGRKGGED